MTLNTLYIVLGTVIGAGVVGRGLWRITGAAHSLINAIRENTTATGQLSGDLSKLREHTHRRLDDHAERIARLEGGHRVQAQPAADTRPAHRRPRRPGPDGGGGMDSL